APLPAHVQQWQHNLLAFLANQTDMRRAERFRTTIAERHARKRPRRLAADLRDDIDLYVITGNRWSATREHPTREPHQAALSEVLATLHQSGSPASPIRLCRELARMYRLG